MKLSPTWSRIIEVLARGQEVGVNKSRTYVLC
jgi:hypothetical protein